MLAAAQAAAEAGDDQEAKNYQDQAEAMAEQLEALKKALEDASESPTRTRGRDQASPEEIEYAEGQVAGARLRAGASRHIEGDPELRDDLAIVTGKQIGRAHV